MRSVVLAFSVLAVLVLAMVAGGVHMVGVYVRTHMVTIGELQTVREAVTPREADRLDVSVQLGLGELRVESRADGPAFAANLVENVNEITPTVSYREEVGVGYITVSSVEEMAIPNLERFDDAVIVWDVALNQDLPISLTVEMGAGEAYLDLRDLPLTHLATNMGAGETIVDLRGVRPYDLTAVINGGTGGVTVFLPVSAGVYVEASTGIGGVDAVGLTRPEEDENVWVNDRYGLAEQQLELEANVGVGGIELIAGDDEE